MDGGVNYNNADGISSFGQSGTSGNSGCVANDACLVGYQAAIGVIDFLDDTIVVFFDGSQHDYSPIGICLPVYAKCFDVVLSAFVSLQCDLPNLFITELAVHIGLDSFLECSCSLFFFIHDKLHVFGSGIVGRQADDIGDISTFAVDNSIVHGILPY